MARCITHLASDLSITPVFPVFVYYDAVDNYLRNGPSPKTVPTLH